MSLEDDFDRLFYTQVCGRSLALGPRMVVTIEGANYAVKFPYDAAVVSQLKTISPAKRQWEPERKLWLITPDAIEIVVSFLQEKFGPISIPQITTTAENQTVRRIVKLEYLGACKARGDGEPTAMGYSEGQWRVVVPQSVLETYFSNSSSKGGHQTLYQQLCVVESASAQEIKSAYRRLARSFHPDFNKEDGARERFEAIQAAYELLSDSILRKKYDCGLYFERQENGQGGRIKVHFYSYVPPLRCGLLKVAGVMELARLRVSKIVEWLDITDDAGRVLVTTWPMGAKDFRSIWLAPDSIAATSPF